MNNRNYEKYFTNSEIRIIKVMGVEEILDDLTDYYEQGNSNKNVQIWIHKAYTQILNSHNKFCKAIREGVE